jgi:hypothetical protein
MHKTIYSIFIPVLLCVAAGLCIAASNSIFQPVINRRAARNITIPHVGRTVADTAEHGQAPAPSLEKAKIQRRDPR